MSVPPLSEAGLSSSERYIGTVVTHSGGFRKETETLFGARPSRADFEPLDWAYVTTAEATTMWSE
jgi:hypothetical protein